MLSDTAMQLLSVLGRLLIGGLFVFGGIRHFFLLPVLTPMIAVRGVPFPRETLIAGSLFQTVAGAMLMSGLWVPLAAFGLIVFTLAASVMLLNFWDMEGPAREGAFSACMSNIAIIGGLLLAACVP